MGKRRRARKKGYRYPHNPDIIEAILELLSRKPYVHPLDFVDEVRKVLEEKGFYTGLVTAKRIWRLYRLLVERGRIPDILGVVPGYGGVEDLSSVLSDVGTEEGLGEEQVPESDSRDHEQ